MASTTLDRDQEPSRYVVDAPSLPPLFPTQRHESEFWEWLGRTVATFGFLEEVLGKAIFAFTGTRTYSEEELAKAMEGWLPKLERALSDTLAPLADAYAKAVREHPEATIVNLDELVHDLKAASKLRNVLCHGSWRLPDANGASVPLFVTKDMQVFDTPVDVEYLKKTQRHTAELAAAVINTVTHMGWSFPGSTGPGKPIY